MRGNKDEIDYQQETNIWEFREIRKLRLTAMIAILLVLHSNRGFPCFELGLQALAGIFERLITNVKRELEGTSLNFSFKNNFINNLFTHKTLIKTYLHHPCAAY